MYAAARARARANKNYAARMHFKHGAAGRHSRRVGKFVASQRLVVENVLKEHDPKEIFQRKLLEKARSNDLARNQRHPGYIRKWLMVFDFFYSLRGILVQNSRMMGYLIVHFPTSSRVSE